MHSHLERGNMIARIVCPILWVQSRHFELGRQGMTSDGRSKWGINLVDEIIHMVYSLHGIFHLFHGSFHLVHLSLSLSKYGTLRVTVPLDWSLLALFSTLSYPKFWPHSPLCCWRCLLTSLINSWFCYVSSVIAAAMDCNCCWTVMGGGGARFRWLKTFPLSWCPRLIAIDLVRTMQPFCLGK